MRVLIIKGRKVIYKGEGYEAVLPGADGEFSVMDFHQPLLYRLRKGIVKIREAQSEKKQKFFPVKDGIAKFRGNSLVVLGE
ncbi:MAG: hypothetical protein ABH869_02160 [Candidatus Omnitrophota bacterium]